MLGLLLANRWVQVAVAAVVAFGIGYWRGYVVADDAAEVARLKASMAAIEEQAKLAAEGEEVAKRRARQLAAEAGRYRRMLRQIEEAEDADDPSLVHDALRSLRDSRP